MPRRIVSASSARIRKHNKIVRALEQMARDAGLVARREPHVQPPQKRIHAGRVPLHLPQQIVVEYKLSPKFFSRIF